MIRSTLVIQAATEKVAETLTPEQRQTWKEMVGKPFTPRLNRE